MKTDEGIPQSHEQKFMTVFYISFYFFILPILAFMGMYFTINYVDNNHIKIPHFLSKTIWIPVVAVLLGTIAGLYIFFKTIYIVVYNIPTEQKKLNEDDGYDYRLLIILWLTFIILIFFILGLFLNNYL
ncbi:MAG: hypothetical protein ABIP68_09220 [Ferruginibacter sp.]